MSSIIRIKSYFSRNEISPFERDLNTAVKKLDKNISTLQRGILSRVFRRPITKSELTKLCNNSSEVIKDLKSKYKFHNYIKLIKEKTESRYNLILNILGDDSVRKLSDEAKVSASLIRNKLDPSGQ